jgi:hypothetical protein
VHLSASEFVALGFSVIGIVIQIAILSILNTRKLKSSFPVFYAYIAFSTVAMALLDVTYVVTSLQSAIAKYFYVYWALNGLQMVLQLAVMYEVLVNALKPYSALIDLGKMLFGWAALFLLIAAALTTMGSGTSSATRCVAAVEHFERGTLLIQCGLLFLFFLFERRLGLSWRSRSISVGIGLGFLSTLTLVFFYLRQHFVAQVAAINVADNLTSTAVVALWAVCLYLPEPQKKNVLDSSSKLIFQRWNEALMATPFGSGGGAMAFAGNSIDSFLPSVEKTVERVMARKIVQ